MERHEVLAMMTALKLAGMRAAYDDILADGLKRRHPQRQTLEERRDGAQMDRRRLAGGPEDLPSPQGLSSAAHTPKRSSRST